jgi:hypothetical protein
MAYIMFSFLFTYGSSYSDRGGICTGKPATEIMFAAVTAITCIAAITVPLRWPSIAI